MSDMKVAYIAGKYRADTEWEVLTNIRTAEEYALKYSAIGYAVICPHKNTAFQGGYLPDQYFLDATMELMRRSDVVVMIPGWEESEGATLEHNEAFKLKKMIIYEVGK
jgi:hypothetical protein